MAKNRKESSDYGKIFNIREFRLHTQKKIKNIII